jgi:Fic family protein
MDQQVASIHVTAVEIHPFLDGNGRWARLLADIWSARQAGWIVHWPEKVADTASPIRDRYISAVREGIEGNFDPLIALQMEYRELRWRVD